MFGGHRSQEAGGASPFGTSDTDEVSPAQHVIRRHLVGDHRVLANSLKNLQQVAPVGTVFFSLKLTPNDIVRIVG